MHGFGYIPRAFDRRNLAYDTLAMKRHGLLPEASARRTRYWWPSGLWRDQGVTSSCVGHAFAHYLEDGPVTQPRYQADPMALYHEAQTLDPWGPRTSDDGTTVDACAKVLRRHGVLERYYFAFTLSETVLAVLEWGPVVIGTPWYSQMSQPTPEGVLKDAGRYQGGHATVLNGVSLDREAFRLKNSWGRAWGHRGCAWLPFDVLARLLDDGSEVCIGVEVAR